jgi:hypothetical protein
MKKSFLMYKRIARLSGIMAVLAVTVFAIPSTVIVSPAEAATVTSGTCTATVDDATGVTMAVASNGDCVLSFATAATTPTTSTESATRTWTVPSSVSSVQALVVAGGGGGGSSNGCCYDAGAGGGGGVVVATSFAVTAGQSITVKTGFGGRGTYCGNGLDGGNSQFGTLVAIGGGRGGGCSVIAGTGGSGGGAHCYVAGGVSNQATSGTASNGSTVTAYGRNGGASTDCSNGGGGGGGGASEVGAVGTGVGSSGPSGGVGGKGGEGIANSLRTDSAVVYGSGGGGQGRWMNASGGTNGGSGSGTNASGGVGIDGVDETGGGGGAGWRAGVVGQAAGDGGSGIVVIRYSIPGPPSSLALPVVTGTARTGDRLTTSNGSWTGTPTSYVYQWKRASTSGGSYTNIPSATDRTYDLTDADIDKYIKVSVIAANSLGSSSAALSVATSIVVDLADSAVPTATTPVATATGFTFTISNYSNSYTYALTTTNGSASRSLDNVTVTGLIAGESATVTIGVTRANYKPASKAVFGSAFPAPTTTTTAAPALSIVIQAPVTTIAQGQSSVATLPLTTTTVASASPKAAVTTTTTLPAVVAPTTTTTTVGPPVVDKVDAGQTAVQVDGVKTAATVTRDNNQMVVTAGALSATLSGLDKTGKRSALDSDGNIHLAAGDEIKISVGGFKPKSLVEVWLFSTPTQLGSAVVGADGTVSETYRLPAGTKSGTHRVVVTARLANGKPTTFTLGILVGDISTTSTVTRVLIAIPIALAIGFGFLLPNQLRRRRKTRIA